MKVFCIGGPYHGEAKDISDNRILYGLYYVDGPDKGRYEVTKFGMKDGGVIPIFIDSQTTEQEASKYLWEKFLIALGVNDV